MKRFFVGCCFVLMLPSAVAGQADGYVGCDNGNTSSYDVGVCLSNTERRSSAELERVRRQALLRHPGKRREIVALIAALNRTLIADDNEFERLCAGAISRNSMTNSTLRNRIAKTRALNTKPRILAAAW